MDMTTAAHIPLSLLPLLPWLAVVAALAVGLLVWMLCSAGERPKGVA
jgi:hypothetical protein